MDFDIIRNLGLSLSKKHIKKQPILAQDRPNHDSANNFMVENPASGIVKLAGDNFRAVNPVCQINKLVGNFSVGNPAIQYFKQR